MTIQEIFVASDGGGSYEWDEVHVYRRLSDNALASHADGGCSCNCYETPREDELAWRHTRAELMADFRSVLEGIRDTTAADRLETAYRLEALIKTGELTGWALT